MRVPGMTHAKLAAKWGLKSPSAIAKRLKRHREATGEAYARALGPKTVVRPMSLSLTNNV